MNSSQLHRPLYSPSSHEVYWRERKSLNVDRQKASIQGGRELLHRLPPVLEFSEDRRESQPEEPDSRNEADIEPEAEEQCLWELNALVTSINKLDINNISMKVHLEGGWIGVWLI